jgi:hypothetical protein
MRRRQLPFPVVLVSALTLGMAPSAADAPVVVFAPVLAGAAPAKLLPPETPGAAVALIAGAECSRLEPGKGLLVMSWAHRGEGGEQRIDITAFPDGFERLRYQTTHNLPPDQTAAVLERPEPGINYFWRVLTQTEGGWVTSEVARADAPTCPVDSAEE